MKWMRDHYSLAWPDRYFSTGRLRPVEKIAVWPRETRITNSL